ncbi:MAG: hypothetical protein JJ896_08900 [Rhodothermales bacterium]|nr:hypothetical protein [Rhodothermales bacterium]MBO6779756.1 hypothetical protein [Rhodothermales bacterium]
MLKTNPAFIDVLVESVIDLLQRGRTVDIPGVGTLSVRHEPAGPGPDASPHDRVVFNPSKS